VLRQKGDLDGASDELRAALQLDPNDGAAHQSLGMVYRQKRDAAQAQQEFQKAEELNQAKMNLQAATLATNTGTRQLGQGDVDGAIEKSRAALKLRPDFAPAHFQLARALRQKGNAAEAEEEFEKALQLRPHLKAPPVKQ
jgi:Tfp pilus assembly protein PilF